MFNSYSVGVGSVIKRVFRLMAYFWVTRWFSIMFGLDWDAILE